MALRQEEIDAGLLRAPLAAMQARGIEVAGCRVKALRPSQTRPVLQYVLSCPDPATGTLRRKVLIGKGYYRGGGAEIYQTMTALWQKGFAGDKHLAMPEPVDWVAPLRLLLQTKAPGRSLYESLQSGPEVLPRVHATGRWLAKLHAIPFAGGPPWGAEREGPKVRGYADALAALHPAHAARIRALAEDVLDQEAGLAQPMVPTHGDYQPKNICVWRTRLSVIDFDRYALAHPGRDLGHFVGQSMTMSYARTGSFEQIAPWNRTFLDGYISASADPSTALEGLAAFTVRTFLEVLYYKLIVRPVRDPSFIPAWLDACELIAIDRDFLGTGS